jgi:hypothetical protein
VPGKIRDQPAFVFSIRHDTRDQQFEMFGIHRRRVDGEIGARGAVDDMHDVRDVHRACWNSILACPAGITAAW